MYNSQNPHISYSYIQNIIFSNFYFIYRKLTLYSYCIYKLRFKSAKVVMLFNYLLVTHNKNNWPIARCWPIAPPNMWLKNVETAYPKVWFQQSLNIVQHDTSAPKPGDSTPRHCSGYLAATIGGKIHWYGKKLIANLSYNLK